MNLNSNQEIRLLGNCVKVLIDRPLKSLHPEYGFKYELNYGFVPNTLANDGEEIDAYVLGVSEPLQKFEGIVKAVIIRKNDIENKLVVAKPEYILSEAEIITSTFFQEKYFDIEIMMGK